MKLWSLACFAFLTAVVSSNASAAIVFKIDATNGGPNAITAQIGSSGFLTGFLEVSGADLGQQFNTWQATLQVGAGPGNLANLTLGAVGEPLVDVMNQSVASTGGNPQTLFSFHVGAAPALAARTELFRVQYTIGAGAALNDVFTFDITGGPGGSPTTVSGPGALSAPTFAGTEFTITAVPEPSSIALLGVVGLAGIGYRRWRKK